MINNLARRACGSLLQSVHVEPLKLYSFNVKTYRREFSLSVSLHPFFPSNAACKTLLSSWLFDANRAQPGRSTSYQLIVRAYSDDGSPTKNKAPARLAQKQQMLDQRTEEFTVEDEGPVPQVTIDHVTVSFARSGGAGGQNVNKVNTKVDMRFNVWEAEWLSERIRLKIIELEQNRINSDGELVISSTKTRTQKGNIEDALRKIQAIIEKASYVPPPPSAEKQKKIAKLARAENERRLENKKKQSNKKADRRNKNWD